jgi:hypothetical protein
MKIILYIKKNTSPKTYWSFDLIELNFINTCQVWSITLTLFNVFFQIFQTKKRWSEEAENNNNEAIAFGDWLRRQKPDVFYGFPTTKQLFENFKKQ